MRDKLRTAISAVFMSAVPFSICLSAGSDPVPDPEAVAGAADPSDTVSTANVVVPHAIEEPVRHRETSQPVQRKTPEETIELTDVGEVVAIPDSVKSSAAAPEHRWQDSVVVGEEEDGKLKRKAMGTWTGYYMSEDSHLLIEGIDENTVLDGERTTRPLLIVMVSANGKHYPKERYPVSIKSVKSGENGLEPGKKLRGVVKAIGEGIKPGTIDVYLELDPNTKDGKKVLVRGTFEESTIPCLREEAEPEAEKG